VEEMLFLQARSALPFGRRTYGSPLGLFDLAAEEDGLGINRNCILAEGKSFSAFVRIILKIIIN
jgi:hypothetical protein